MILFGGAGLDGDDRSINLCDLHKLDTAPDESARECTRVHESARECTRVHESARECTSSTPFQKEGKRLPATWSTWKKKERKKTHNPREGWEDGTPPPHTWSAVINVTSKFFFRRKPLAIPAFTLRQRGKPSCWL